MAEKYDDYEENISTAEFLSEGKEVPAWVALVGTYSVLTAYNKFVGWLSSFLDAPPWAIVSRDIALSVTNVLLGEFVARRAMKGPPGDKKVDTAIRAGYIAASVQTLSTGMYEAYMKRKNGTLIQEILFAKTPEEAEKLYLEAKEKARLADKALIDAEMRYKDITGKDITKQESATQASSNVGGYGNTPKGMTRRTARKLKAKALGGMSC
jgi:hypothetical protein